MEKTCYITMAVAGLLLMGCGSSKSSQQTSDGNTSVPMLADNGQPQGRMGNGGGPGGGSQGMPPQGPPPGGGMAPGGMPPGGGMMPPGGGQGGPGGQEFDAKLIEATVMATEGSTAKSKEEISASGENQSAVAAFNDSRVELSGNTIITSGNTSSQDHSSFQGLNAAVLGRDNAEIVMSGNTITTTGLGANAIFAYGKSVVRSDNDIIICTGNGGHGIMCSGGGTIHASNISITTSGRNSAPVATDRGSGVITVDNGRIVSHGEDSPSLYSTGQLVITNSKMLSDGSEVAVIEGSNLISLDNCELECSYADKCGVMIYQSFSGDAEGVDGEFKANNSTIKVTGEGSPLFFVTNSTAYITLQNNVVECVSGVLVNAAASRWGNKGSNGGTAVIKTAKQKLRGDLKADAYSSLRLSLDGGSSLTGAVNAEATAKSVEVEVGADSRWELSADSYVSAMTAAIEGDAVANIVGNGHNLFYDAAQSPSLGGKTYKLQGGGELKPKP